MYHHQESLSRGHPDGDESIFVFGMVRIGHGPRKRVPEDARCLLERDAVLLAVPLGLARIPLDKQRHCLTLLAHAPPALPLTASTSARAVPSSVRYHG